MSKEKDTKTFSIRFTEEENAWIEKVRMIQNQKRPLGYKELDKTGAVRVLLEFGNEAFKHANGIAEKKQKKNS